MYAVILAGGGGTRLHPLSTPERPKPFLPLIEERTLLQATIDRLGGLTTDVTIVTDRRYERLVREQAPDAALLLEPMGRNTAAAVALATLRTLSEFGDSLVLVVPSDHEISTTAQFWQTVAAGVPAARDGRLVVFGVTPTQPETGYGYIEAGRSNAALSRSCASSKSRMPIPRAPSMTRCSRGSTSRSRRSMTSRRCSG